MSSTDQSKLISEIQNFVLETTYGDKAKITESVYLFRDGYFDSMGFVSLIAFIEEKYKVKVKDDELLEENFETIKAIADFITRKEQD
jgi:acyl carrier protein